MRKLVIEDDEGRATVVPLIRDELTIGRTEGNAIRLTERNVSRRHARVRKVGAEVIVEDLGSHNGVRVNGVRIERQTTVRDGDEIRIGDYKLAIRADVATSEVPVQAHAAHAGHAPGAADAFARAAAAAAAAPAENMPTLQVPVHAALATPLRASTDEGVAQRPFDASPTMPLQSVPEAARLSAAPAAPPARLVVVTSALAGTEFLLDRPSLVLGRTAENDIVVNHPSISRHHAKIVHDGDRYTVVDLQSANGVRVQGETYERVDVQPGDVLELGHVKLRFVGAREPWVFDPREFAPKSGGAWKIGAAVGGVGLAVLLVLLLQGKKPETVAGPVAPAAVTVAPRTAEPTPTELLARASRAAQAEDWDSAVTTLDLLLGRPASDEAATALRPQVAELKRKVDSERRAKDLLASFEQAVAAKEPDVAMSRFDDIPADSLYKPRARPQLDGVRVLFLAAHLELAEAARGQGHCDDARGEVEKIQQIDPENRRALEILKGCRPRSSSRGVTAVAAAGASAAAPAPPSAAAAAVVSSGRVGPAAPRAAATPSTRTAAPVRTVTTGLVGGGGIATTVGGSTAARQIAPRSVTATSVAPTSESSESDAADLIRQAREAWSRQQCTSAIDLSRRALRLRPGSIEAHQIMAVCSCSSRDREGALKSYVRLDERSREMVRTLCGRYGLELGE